MKKQILLLVFLILLLAMYFWIAEKKKTSYNIAMNNTDMKIESLAFKDGDNIPSRFTCDGEDINPELLFKNVPINARSLALIVDDPDAPMGTWVHWVLWNIPPSTTEIKENSVPKGAMVGANSWPKNSFGGPCPHNGLHRYFFKLYAFDTVLNIPSTSQSKDLSKAMESHILSQAQLIGKYQRK